MRIGVPAEIKIDEYRVAVTPAGVREMAEHGHEVLVEAGAGLGSAIADEEYAAQGARSSPTPPRSSREAEMILKVKEPQPGDRDAAPGPAPLHLPASGARPRADRGLCGSGATASLTRRSRTPAGGCRCWRR